MADNCIFCKIIAREIEGSFVYEDDEVVAFMDINQPNPYKVLIAPRDHAETIFDLDDMQAVAVMLATVKIAHAIRAVSNCDGLHVFQLNGATAGQEVFHYHNHILPRHAGDGGYKNNRIAPRDELDKLAADLRDYLASQL